MSHGARDALRATLALIAVVVLSIAGLAPSAAFETSAKQAYLVDVATGTVLFAQNADEPMVPASMAKIMTVETIAEEIRQGRLDDADTFVVSENAWRRGGAPSGGSTMFAEVGSEIALPDLLRGIIVHSGNDASIAAAEGIAGSEEAFARMMTRHAREIGLERSEWRNATGYHDPEQVTTARELADLTLHLIRESPEIYAIFGEESFAWNGITQRNRNDLLTMNIGADGVKTGFLSESGYGLVGSAVQDGQRLIVVVNGLDTARERANEARKLLEWGFRAFERRRLFEPGEVVGEAQVFGGASPYVALTASRPIEILLPRGDDQRLSARIVYEGPLMPPVDAGVPVGRLRVMRGDALALEAPLETAESVARGPVSRRAVDGLWELGAGAVRRAIFGDPAAEPDAS
ncbi:D-alanyl-D-alanine carboxypeptidase family protein [Salinarimonas ramus]|uniref:D-alanyl-D-alanine carboxypeptidase family protein n=1 Tax=Salinarimonas ramus TaxID=690164 RepID=UPI001FCF24CE|nr:D-alanyl-D-alanine carboxypeptidase family protein [Salinarimonas ramus]